MWRIHNRTFPRLLFLLALSILLAATAMASAADRRPARLDWPPFQMTYEEFGYPNGTTSQPVVSTWVLTWHSLGRWDRELVKSAAAGDAYTFDGKRLIIDLALPGADDIVIDLGDGLPVLPNPWLAPGRDSVLASRGFHLSPGPAPNLIQYQRDVTVPCTAAPPARHPAACATNPTFIRYETILYTTTVSPPLPVELRDEIDGQVVWRVSVIAVMPLQ